MKNLIRILSLCCLLSGCTLIGYDEQEADAGQDGGQDASQDVAPPSDAAVSKDATVPAVDSAIRDAGDDMDAADTGPNIDAAMHDSSVDSGRPRDGGPRTDGGPDAGRLGDGAAHDAGRRDAEQQDAS